MDITWKGETHGIFPSTKYELNMKFPRDIEWMVEKVNDNTGMIRILGFGGIILYAITRGIVIVLGMLIILPLLWLKEKAI